MGVRVESKSHSSHSPNFALYVLIYDFNNMNSFAFESSHSFPFEYFGSNKD